MAEKMKEFYMFYKPQYGEIRACYQDGQVWFMAKNLTETLGYRGNGDGPIRGHVDDEDRSVETVLFEGRKRKAIVLSEIGMLSLVLACRLENAKPVRHWILDEIIPMLKAGNKPDPII